MCSSACASIRPSRARWVVDLSDLDAIESFARRADDELGGIDVLVNNAGIPKRRRVTELSPEVVEAVMAVNYLSPVRLTLALLPRLIERERTDRQHLLHRGTSGARHRGGVLGLEKPR